MERRLSGMHNALGSFNLHFKLLKSRSIRVREKPFLSLIGYGIFTFNVSQTQAKNSQGVDTGFLISNF